MALQQKFTRIDMQLGGAAFVLLISLLFFPWFSVSIGPLTLTSTGTGNPDGWLGVIGMLAALAICGDLLIERLSPQTRRPSIGGSPEQTRLVLAGAAAGCVVLKFLFHIHFGLFGWGFYLTALSTAALVYSAVLARKAA